jgi:ribosomal protein L11 methyltransferase
MNLSGRTVLDIGTGSGVLAIAARRLGAAHAVGIDHDPDALRAAAGNLELNAEIDHVTFEVADLSNSVPGPADVVTANLTGALLCREAAALVAAVRPGGVLIASGLLVSERGAVVSAFANSHLAWEQEEDGWVGLGFEKRNQDLRIRNLEFVEPQDLR